MKQLRSLEAVNWRAYKHAYGRANDVPGQLRALLSPSETVRTTAYEALLFNIVHQGTRYQAAVPAVAVLVELLTLPELPDPHHVTRLLAYIAIGYDESYLVSGFDPSWLDGPWPDRIDNGSFFKAGNSRNDWERFGMGPEVEYRCYWAILEHMESILTVYDTRPELRAHLAYLLAWFPLVYPVTSHRLQQAGVDGILALGLLERQLGLEPGCRPMLGHADLSVQTAAAIASARKPLDPQLAKVLQNALKRLPELKQIEYNNGDWRGWICLTLSAYGGGEQLEELLAALPACSPFEALEVTSAILHLIGQGPPEGSRRRALECIHNGPGWGLINYNLLLKTWGFPDTQAGLRRWLDGDQPG